MQEQQTEFNFTKYGEGKLDPSKHNAFKEMNAQTLKKVVGGETRDKSYVFNLDKSGMWGPTYPDFMQCSMKETP